MLIPGGRRYCCRAQTPHKFASTPTLSLEKLHSCVLGFLFLSGVHRKAPHALHSFNRVLKKNQKCCGRVLNNERLIIHFVALWHQCLLSNRNNSNHRGSHFRCQPVVVSASLRHILSDATIFISLETLSMTNSSLNLLVQIPSYVTALQ